MGEEVWWCLLRKESGCQGGANAGMDTSDVELGGKLERSSKESQMMSVLRE